MLRPRILVTSLALIPVGALAACAGQPAPDGPNASRSAEPTVSTSTAPPASSDPHGTLIETATTFLEHFYSGDPAPAHELFTDECKQSLSLDQFTELSEGVQGQEPYMVESVNAEVSDSEGTVQFTLSSNPDEEMDMPWIITDDHWRTPDCFVTP